MFERGYLSLKKLKKRSFFMLLSFAILISVIIWLFNSPQPHLKSIVSKTQLQIKNINSKLDSGSSRSLDSVDSTYLELLGFIKNPKLFVYDKSSSRSVSTARQRDDDLNNDSNQQVVLNRANSDPIKPPFVSAFSRFTEKERALIESKMKFFLPDLFIIYDLDLSSSEQLKIKKLCNSSCLLKTFKGDKYPGHLVDQKIKAYKPIIIQEILNQFGGIMWIEPPNIFTSSRIEPYVQRALQTGLFTWPLEQPITQMTHPSMFKYLDTEPPSQFYFIHMLDTSKFIIYNTRDIHVNLMLEWVKCALKEECIAPPGSKFYGCDLDRRPQFLYSGCHRYEMSAFSILVARMFELDESSYTLTLGRNISEELRAEVTVQAGSFIQTYENLLISSGDSKTTDTRV